MFAVLNNRSFALLFSAQVIALIGTGLMTVALGLLAFDLAGASAGAVLGTAFTIKMLAYVGLAPVANAIAETLPRKALLIGADILRAAVALALPFVSEIWQIYGLIFILQAASASFTPAFQATIPDILPDEGDYTRALSLSRVAYDLENLLSPALAGLVLLLTSYHGLFGGTFLGFIGSALLVWSAPLPARKSAASDRRFLDRLTLGTRIYLATPRLRGLLALSFTAASGAAFILVNTIVMVRSVYGLGAGELAFAMAAFGAGSMFAAVIIPRLLEHSSERKIMLQAGFGLAALTLLHGGLLQFAPVSWIVFLLIWVLSGAFYSAIMTPSGRLLRRSSHGADRPAVFAAQFALSHACWLLCYPIAGWAGTILGLANTMLILGAMTAISAALALWLWPAEDNDEIPHDHPDLAPNHPHLKDHRLEKGRHAHPYVIDDEHKIWPTQG